MDAPSTEFATRRELIIRIYAEWLSGDYSRGDFAHPGYELVFAPGFLEEGVYRGSSAALRAWKGWLDGWESWEYTPVEWRELDENRILVLIDIDGVNKSTRMKLSVKSANLWEFEDGLVRRLTLYAHREDLFRDLGLESP